MKRSKAIWIAVVVLAIVTFVVVSGVVAGARDVQPVVVAAKPLNVGQRLGPGDVQVQEIAASAVLPGAFETVEDVVGQTVAVARAPGDQVTATTLGDGENPLVATLPAGWRAVGITVNEAQGLVGLLKPGDTVGVIAYIEPRQTAVHTMQGSSETQTSTVESSPQARMSLSGLQVLFVPQEFRYVEASPAGQDNDVIGGSGGGLITQSRDRTGVVVLAAPATPITVTLPMSLTGVTTQTTTVTPVELLALLDDSGEAEIHLVLEPEDAEPAVAQGVAINDLLMHRRERYP